LVFDTNKLMTQIHRVLLLLFVGLVLLFQIVESQYFNISVTQTPVDVARDLIKRLLPDHVHLFQLDLIDDPSPDSGNVDVFELETINQRHGNFNFTVAIRGNNAISIASGLHHYLKYYCRCQVSWGADQLNVPNPPPTVPKQRILTQHKYRYYFNTCTHGYSAAWWDWKRWEREIDWMALNGINAPLAFTGQEIIWRDVYQKLNVPIDDFFTGPAFLPWNRMGNINGWAGPLPQYWMEKQLELAKKILERERLFGMKPILPAFAGYVPPQFKKTYPSAKVVQLDKWAQGFNGTFFLDPLDEMFQIIGKAYLQKQTELLGTDHLYNADPFNEEIPPTKDTGYLSAVSKAVLKSMQDVDSKAMWVMQAWFLVNDRQFWQPPQAKAFLNAIPKDDLLILDLWAENIPIWNTTESFYGHHFIWNMLHNFGGRPGLYGKLHSLTRDLVESKRKNLELMQGIGLTPEAIENNPIAYDMLTDMTWRSEAPDFSSWVEDYVHRRYGSKEANAMNAWKLLQNSVYSCKTNQMGPSGSIVAARPALKIDYISKCNIWFLTF
jgi:alpha-N-acetylglucosaminidase